MFIPVHLEISRSCKYNHHLFSCAIKEKPPGFELQEAQKLCNLYKNMLTCHSSADRAWDQFFVLSRFSQDGSRGKGCRSGELCWWRQHPTPPCLLSPGLETCFPLQKGQGQPEHSVPSSRATGPYLHILLNSCSCIKRKAALCAHWKRYDPVNQKTWTLLIYWINARAGIKSPGSAVTRLHAVLIEWGSKAWVLQQLRGDNHLGLFGLNLLSSQIAGMQHFSPLSPAVPSHKQSSMENLCYEPLSLFLTLGTNFWQAQALQFGSWKPNV